MRSRMGRAGRFSMLALVGLGVLASLTFALSACGGGGGETSASPKTSESGSAMPGMKDSGSGSASASATVVPVKLGEFYVKLPSTTLKAGEYTFKAENVGTIMHMLMVEKAPVVMEKPNQPSEEEGVAIADTGTFPPGQTKSITVTLKPGKYVLFCNVPGHYAAGQHATMTVT
jgi:uncharacterized cupredoxin-like copper-binding protein